MENGQQIQQPHYAGQIAKISRGTKMNQIYLPKNHPSSLSPGQYVLIYPLESMAGQKPKQKFKPFFYNLARLEPLKIEIAEKIFNIIEQIQPKCQNIVITGSFLEPGFRFNDIDILIIGEENSNAERIRGKIEKTIGIKAHIIPLDSKTLISGLSSDPLFSLMLSKCISKSRLIFKVKRTINYKHLDLQLLKSKALIGNFEVLNGDEKYYLTMNLISILLFVQDRKLSKEIVNNEIEKAFNIKIKELKENTLEKSNFIKKYKEVYDKTFNLIMDHIK